jgi:ABC-type sugar transport system permease subunit
MPTFAPSKAIMTKSESDHYRRGSSNHRGNFWPWRWNYYRREQVSGLLFILPVMFFFLTFNMYPMLRAFVVSFQDYDLFTPARSVGFENYLNLLGNRRFWRALQVTISYTLVFGVASWLVGFVLALLISGKVWGRGFFRAVFFLPSILSAVAMATAWSLLLQANGPINAILGVRILWLTTERTALVGIALMGIWQGMGWFMVVFLAGLKSISQTHYDAAQIDGAGPWQLLRYITLPLMRPVFAFVVVQTLIGGMKIFTPMFIMTGGGPNDATRSFAMLVYQEGLRDLRMGSASAMSVIGFVLVLILTVMQLRLFRVREGIEL